MLRQERIVTSINAMNMFNLMEKSTPQKYESNHKKDKSEISESFDSLFHTEIDKLKKKV